MATITPRGDTDIISVAPVHHDVDEKADVKHFEEGGAGDVIMKSPFEDLGFKKTWVVFHRVALMCLFAAFSAAAE